MRGTPTLLLAFVGSCYNPSYSGHYVCDPNLNGSDCPDGWLCVDQQCAPPPDGSDGAVDLAGTATDGGDGSPCLQGGMQILSIADGNVWACKGDFTFGQLDPLCDGGAGYHPCRPDAMGRAMDSSLLSMISCDGIIGFYLIDQDVSTTKRFKEYDAKCDPLPTDHSRALLGCGNDPAAVTLSNGGCDSLRTALLCPASGDWYCNPDVGIKTAYHHNAQRALGGVLCCKELK